MSVFMCWTPLVPPDLLLSLLHVALSLWADLYKLCQLSFFNFRVLVELSPWRTPAGNRGAGGESPQSVNCPNSFLCGMIWERCDWFLLWPQQLFNHSSFSYSPLWDIWPLPLLVPSSLPWWRLSMVPLLEVLHPSLPVSFHLAHIFVNSPFVLFSPKADL